MMSLQVVPNRNQFGCFTIILLVIVQSTMTTGSDPLEIESECLIEITHVF